MCGIAGFFGHLERDTLERMSTVMAHRGPDDSGIWLNENKSVGLAHRRLSIIDTSSAGRQPMLDVNKRAVISFNGEIYNFRELRRDLQAQGHSFHSTTDTEVILNLYLEHGCDCLPMLNGIFAFAIWDLEKQQLLMARDGMGVKPLYYTQHGDYLAFASELKSLLEIPSIDRGINFNALHSYLTYLWSPAPDCMIRSISKLEPGHALIVENGRIKREWQFYEIPYDTEIETRSVSEVADRLDAVLGRAVERQMVADVPVGTFLSGGLDSTAVTSYAARLSRGLQSFSIGFEDDRLAREGFVDDLPYARRAAEHLGVDLNVVSVTSDIINRLNFMIYHLDEPQADPAPINLFYICRLAREKGIKVLLSGAGGDDIFTGYRRHFALQGERYWSWLPGPARRLLRLSTRGLPASSALTRRIKKAFTYADLSRDERLASYFHWIDPDRLAGLFTREARDEMDLDRFSAPLMRTLARVEPGIDPLNKMLFLEGKHFLADHNLNYTDKLSMSTGVEVRVPFLDPDLVAFAYGIPVGMKQRGREGKWIFKKAMERYIPREIIYRPKAGFGAPIRGWLRGELKPVVREVLSEPSLKERGLFDFGRVQKMIQENDSGRIDASYSIFSLLCVEMWFRIFVDRTESV